MSILKKIFSHGWFYALVVVLVIGYYYRVQLFPNLFSDSDSLAQVEGKHADKQVSQSDSQVVSNASDTIGKPESDVTDQSVMESLGSSAVNTPQAGAAQLPDPRPRTQAAPTYRPTSEDAGQNRQMPSQSAQTDRDQAASPALSATLLNQARVAFWSGDYDGAVRSYRSLADDATGDPDVYGELGNVYYAQGKWTEAGEAYYEAADRLLQQGQVARAMYLQRIIHGLDPERAQQLRDKLKEAPSQYR